VRVGKPVIDSVSPNPVTGSDNPQLFTIHGNNFASGANVTLRDLSTGQIFPNRPASSFSSTQIVLNPIFTTAAHTWSVEVINPDGQSSGQYQFQVQSPTGSLPPSINSVSPSSYPASSSNQSMTIFGSNFQSGDTLTFFPPEGGSIPSTSSKLTFVSSGQLSYQFNSASDVGTWSVQVNRPDGTQHSNTVSFTVTGVTLTPSISSVSPSSYPASSSNQTMTLFGSNFQSGDTLTFFPPEGGSIPSTSSKLTFVSSTQLSYQFNNANDVGTWSVQVNSPDGTQHSNAVSFTVTGVTPTPLINSVSPSSYPASSSNQPMTIFGSNFQSGDTLTFFPPEGGSIPSTSSKLTFVSSGQLSYQFNSANDAGTWNVQVNSPDGTQHSNTVSFIVTGVTLTPSLSSVSPSSYPASSSNQPMTIFGSNFQSGDTLTFFPPEGGSIPSTSSKLTFVSSGQLSYQFNNANDVGTWSVQVNSPDGTQHSNTVSFTVTGVTLTPSVSSVSPSSYSASSSNQTMTIFGSNFQSGDTLTFFPPEGGSIPSTSSKLTFVSSTQLSYQFNNANDVGTWSVQVNSPDGTQHSNTVSFTVTGVTLTPSISSVSPSSYPASSSNQTMTIFGSNFQSDDTLTFFPPEGGSIPSTSSKLTFVSSTQLSYQFNNANDVGTWSVRVNSPDGTQHSSTVSFTVTSVTLTPSISSVSPSSYPASSSNQTMTIFGSNFQSGDTLTFFPPEGGSIPSTSSKLTFVSSTQLSYQFNNANDVGGWSVQVNSPDGTQHSNTVSFTVTSVTLTPSISSVSPSSYPASSSNQTMTIFGGNFQSGDTLTFFPPEGGSIPSTSSKLTFVSSTQLSYQFNNANDVGGWSVQVNSPDGTQHSNTVSFTVTSVTLTPSISSVSPSSYPASSSNQTMTIFGSNFQSGDTLTFFPPEGGSIPSTSSKLTFVSSTQLSYQFNNANDVGTWSVRVNSPDGTQHSSTVSFTVTSVTLTPSISSVSPSSYPASSSNQTMTIFGSNFQSGDTLTFFPPEGGSIPSTSSKLTFVSSTQLSYQFNNANDVGTWSVRVNSPDNTQHSSSISFTVH
jgi:hypothetical protein